MKKLSTLSLVGLFGALSLVACSGGGDGTRTIDVETLDSMGYDPAEIQVEAGETVRFVVSNPGTATHEFVLGDESVQMEHEEQAGMGMDHDSMTDSDLPALTLAPGDSQTVEVTFDEPGTILYGCHEVGHYDQGMVGTITVE